MRRRQREADHRIVTVHLTSMGAKAGKVSSGWPEVLAAATEQLSVEEQVRLLSALVKLIRVLQLKGEIPVARMCVSCQHFSPNAHKNRDKPHHCQFFDVSFGDQSLLLDCPEYVGTPIKIAKRA